MASQYFAILTDYGTTAFANALSSKQPLQLTTFAVGDGNGQAVTPTANRTALAREKHRAPVSAVSLDPRNKKQVIVELTIPENVGGFYIREMGVFDNQNKLVAYANCPESFKPTEGSGSGKVQVLRMILKVSSSSAVTLSIDHSVIFVTRQQLNPKTITAATQNGFDETGHTHEIDRATTAKAGIVQLSNDDNSDDETKAPTLKAIKKIKGLYDGLRRLLDSYIPNSKKSNAVNSPSSETVATSAAAKTAYDKGVEAKNAADNAQRTADEAVRFNRNYFSGDLNSLNDKHEVCYLEQAHTKNRNFPSNAYQWGILHVYSNGTLGSQVYYADNGELWARTRWHSHDWNEWKRLDGLNIPTEIAKVKSIADSNTRNFANYIHNSKKSNAVDSTSTDTLATSRAVKLAYDRGTTALNEANTRASKRGLSSSEDLNNVTAAGIYGQNANANATPARHYPIQQAGMLIVTENSGYGAQQLYAPFNAGYLYARGRNANNGWDDWKRIDGLDRVLKSGDTMTGNLTINHGEPRVHGNRNGSNNWYVGLPNGTSNNLHLHSYANNTSLVLESDKISTTKPVFSAGNRTAVSLNGHNIQFRWNSNGNLDLKVDNTELGNIHYTKKAYVYTTADNYGGIVIDRPSKNDRMLVESNGNKFAFIRRNLQTGSNHYAISTPEKNGTMALVEDFTNPAFTVTNNANNNASLNNITGTRFLSFGDGALNGLGLPSGADWVGIQIADQGQQKTQIISGGYDNHYIRTNDDLSKNVWHLERLLTDVTLQRLVNRRDYNRTIKGTNPNWDAGTSKNIAVTGYVVTYPDGKIEQYFYFRNFRIHWFLEEQARDGHHRIIEIPLQLWTAMPNKIEWVEAHISRTNDTNLWPQRTVGSEASEWTKPIWAFEKQGSIKDRLSLYTRRIYGDTNETVDMYIKIEGY